ncbi:MAG TPA: mobile mystery protein B [Candidatus Nanopelagicaceae bacterium]|nr:mobile mystery protein B [Candidatus Nanopelagicaceae bacterium]
MSTDDWRLNNPSGSTPLDDEDALGLKPSWVSTRGDLNAAEQANIHKALMLQKWQSPTSTYLLDDLTMRRLHRDMFCDVWTWAGTYRIRDTNIGFAWERISTSVVGNTRAWLEGDQAMPTDEIAYRLHHQLVCIHPFPNGNGRHAREAADLLLKSLGSSPFSWGGGRLEVASSIRDRYITALRSADAGDFTPLADFVRS